MVKIFIDPGHGGTDPGAVGNGLQEKNLTLQISQFIRDFLMEEYNKVEVEMSRSTDTFVALTERTRLANQWSADYFLSIHINAGGGTGFESYIHTSRAAKTVRLQTTVHNQIMNTLNVTDRGRKSANFAVLRTTSMPAILTECLFIDHANDSANLKNLSFLKQIARGHVNGIVQAFGLERKTTIPNPDTLYKVQSGAFRDQQNALNVKNQLERAGYHPFITLVSSIYRVQVGAFLSRENADALSNELINRGFDAIVIQS